MAKTDYKIGKESRLLFYSFEIGNCNQLRRPNLNLHNCDTISKLAIDPPVNVQPGHNEKDLLRKIALEDDTVAFQQLFTGYYDQLYSTALMYLKVHELAEDVVQQVFLKIWEKRITLEAIEKLSNYLFIIARNEVMNILRKKSNHPAFRNFASELFSDEEYTPEDQLILKQKRALVELAIQKLPPQQQQAYRLTKEKGLSYKEAASVMNLSINTVRGYIASAMQTLKEFFRMHKNDLYLLLLLMGKNIF
ncbi:MAG TPA: RNA polymerase sigma-70 factor [Chitinophagaceae bacterium]